MRPDVKKKKKIPVRVAKRNNKEDKTCVHVSKKKQTQNGAVKFFKDASAGVRTQSGTGSGLRFTPFHTCHSQKLHSETTMIIILWRVQWFFSRLALECTSLYVDRSDVLSLSRWTVFFVKITCTSFGCTGFLNFKKMFLLMVTRRNNSSPNDICSPDCLCPFPDVYSDIPRPQ